MYICVCVYCYNMPFARNMEGFMCKEVKVDDLLETSYFSRSHRGTLILTFYLSPFTNINKSLKALSIVLFCFAPAIAQAVCIFDVQAYGTIILFEGLK